MPIIIAIQIIYLEQFLIKINNSLLIIIIVIRERRNLDIGMEILSDYWDNQWDSLIFNKRTTFIQVSCDVVMQSLR